jgi:hypothetical protein
MAYIGNTPAESFASFEKQVFTIVNSQTAYTLSHSVVNENDIRLVINNVVQEPGSGKAYTASGTTLTLSAALTNGTDTMYCVFLGRALQTVNAPNASVGTAQLADDAVTKAKTSNLMYPAFEARLSANQYGVADAVNTKVQYNTENFDTDNCYDNSTNYRFTPTVAGKYFVYVVQRIIVHNNSQLVSCSIDIKKNGSTIDGGTSGQNLSDNYIRAIICPMNLVVDMNGSSDYLEVFGDYNANDNVTTSSGFHSAGSKFGAYRIGD